MRYVEGKGRASSPNVHVDFFFIFWPCLDAQYHRNSMNTPRLETWWAARNNTSEEQRSRSGKTSLSSPSVVMPWHRPARWPLFSFALANEPDPEQSWSTFYEDSGDGPERETTPKISGLRSATCTIWIALHGAQPDPGKMRGGHSANISLPRQGLFGHRWTSLPCLKQRQWESTRRCVRLFSFARIARAL